MDHSIDPMERSILDSPFDELVDYINGDMFYQKLGYVLVVLNLINPEIIGICNSMITSQE